MSLSKAIKDIIYENMKKIEQGFIAKIVSYDPKTMRAEISPQLEFITEIEGQRQTIQAPNIINVPCELLYAGGFYIRPVYKKDDLVKCSLCSSNITKPLDVGTRSDTNDNRFSLSYVTVSGGVIPKNFTPPAQWDRDGLVIGNDSGFIEIAENGDVILNGDQDSAVAYTDLKTAFDQLKSDVNDLVTAFNAHVHPTAAPGPPSPPTPVPGSIPATPSAADMSGAEVNNVKLP